MKSLYNPQEKQKYPFLNPVVYYYWITNLFTVIDSIPKINNLKFNEANKTWE